MEQNSLIEIMKKATQRSNVDFYTPNGLHVYFKNELLNDDLNVEKVISKFESLLPKDFSSLIEMIIIGQFEEFEERSINAFYDSGTIYVSNIQDDFDDLLDDIIHETAHAVEEQYGFEIYGDRKIHDEFLQKRMFLHDLLWNMDYRAPRSFFKDVEFNQEFDDFLFKKVGYDNFRKASSGVFLTPYAATSLREYFATAFTEYYMDSNHKFLSKVAKAPFEKIISISEQNEVDNYY